MNTVDTSVVVAAFAPWHEHHEVARKAMGRQPYLADHCSLEVYATLTRLPDPFRVPAETAATYLERRFGARRLSLPTEELRGLPERLAALGVMGGSTYDALVGATALANGAVLKTLDRRAEHVYRALGVDYELVGGG